MNNKDMKRRYDIKVKGYNLNLDDQINIHQRVKEILNLVSDETSLKLDISANSNEIKVKLQIMGPEFGCNLESTTKSLIQSLFKVTDCAKEEISKWNKSKISAFNFSPFIGGYPSYYKELSL